ncbi:MAG: DUF1329 domain-containing protein [Dissulfuribacterales bacterium]
MNRKIFFAIIALCSVLIFFQTCIAKVTKEEADLLKSTLTPMGAERAGNKEGTIPTWDGGYTKVPEGWKPGDYRPDFFADEKPLYSITAKNMDQHLDKLAEGSKALFKKYPAFRIDVYPTHRSAAAPQYVYDATYQNALNAELTDGGLNIKNAYNGIPFPIPKTGVEYVFNHLLRWRGVETKMWFNNFLMTSSGKLITIVMALNYEQYSYYRNDISYEEWNGGSWYMLQLQLAPSYKAGESILLCDPIDFAHKGRQTWQYLVGQRRVRRSPQISFDTPDFVASGHNFFDEALVYNGSPERYNWKFIEKKEMVVPYNDNDFLKKSMEEVYTPNYMNPDYLRWELHRVYVVEGTLAEGKRHVVPKRRFYLDEDTWAIVLYDGWDAQGELWRFGVALSLLAPDYPCIVTTSNVLYNIQTGAYGGNNIVNGQPQQMYQVEVKENRFYTPQNLSAMGVR